ncbi:transmembrane protein, putative [Medicago truncatula]|uniref:Transmembrane protein, putative n=1 Tax=Medicago truncatula TaxID=3880 RepID=G7KHS1_MEDTR|nr:transmembrane protein, putative [Medicago truncatula]
MVQIDHNIASADLVNNCYSGFYISAPRKIISIEAALRAISILPVWYQVSRWLGWEFVIPMGLAQQFLSFTGLGRGNRVRIGLFIVWHAVIWTIWMFRNDLIFSSGTLNEGPVVDRASTLSLGVVPD